MGNTVSRGVPHTGTQYAGYPSTDERETATGMLGTPPGGRPPGQAGCRRERSHAAHGDG
jgi:hypothetical protein